MCTLPTEILEVILSLALFSTSCDTSHGPRVSPTSILLSSSTFRAIGSQLIYGRLRFSSTKQLHAFLGCYRDPEPHDLGFDDFSATRIPFRPRSIELNIADADASTRMFLHMRNLFLRLLRLSSPPPSFDDAGSGDAADEEGSKGKWKRRHAYDRLELDTLRLGFNSHIKDEGLGMIEDALELVDPQKFIWTSPDTLPHHFSIAIVPRAVPPLFLALSKFTRLRHLTLTHIALMNMPSDVAPFPLLPSLETFTIQQATFVEPWRITEVVLGLAGIPNPNIKEIRLVDVYIESIWGPRLRRSDLESAAATSAQMQFQLSDGDPSLAKEAAKETIRGLVKCQAKTERKYGGDRALESAPELV